MHILNCFHIPLIVLLPLFTLGQSGPDNTIAGGTFGSVVITGSGTEIREYGSTKGADEKPFHIKAVYETSECASSLASIEVNNAHLPLTWYELDTNGLRVHTLFNPQLNHFNNRTTYVVVDVTQHTDTIFINFEKSLAVEKVFPNPHTGYLWIEYSAMEETQMEITLMDVSGKTVFGTPALLNPGQNRLTLHLDHLQEGMYFLVLKGPCINELLKTIHMN